MEQVNGNGTLSLKEKFEGSIEAPEEVRVVRIDEHERAAQSLAEAFAVDEIARYFIDTDDMATYSDEYKWKLHCNIMKCITAAHCYKGIVTTIGPDYDAVALWMPPGASMDDMFTKFRSGMWRLHYQLSPEGRIRLFKEFFPLLHDTKHEVMGPRDGDSYYLVYIGSKPSARGKGYAKKLIDHMTTIADGEGRATYLESSAESNVSYYRRYGFVEKKVIECKRGRKPLPLHIMVREPQGKQFETNNGGATIAA